MAEDRKKLIEVQDLVVRFGSRRHAFTAVDNVSFHIYQGETFGLVGESGSGKTTIGRAIIRIHPTAGGKILFDGKQINGRISKALDREVTQRIQMIFQDPMSSLNERAKVDYIVSEGLYAGGHHLSESERQAKVASGLSDVGLLPEFASRFPHEFSGGHICTLHVIYSSVSLCSVFYTLFVDRLHDAFQLFVYFFSCPAQLHCILSHFQT